MDEKNPFPDYEPKKSPDTINDYIGPHSYMTGDDAMAILGRIPEAKLKNLPAALAMFKEFQQKAKENPGKMEPGNILLGADPEEYIPSTPELVLSELGAVIITIIDSTPKGELKEYLSREGIESQELEFTPVFFRHMDVMGSGRFFYAYKGEPMKIVIP